MINQEGNEGSLSRSQRMVRNLRDRFSRTEESKERRIIQGLPPVVIRLFGDIDYEEQLRDIPGKFREKVIILTPSDTAADTISTLYSENWNVVQSQDVTTEQAKTNSGLLLNEAIKFGKEQKISYLFFLSSGFQGSLDMLYSMYYEVSKEHPHQDVYYFILPETHTVPSIEIASNEPTEDIEGFLLRRFPFETALIVKADLLQFETSLSRKGAMGSTENGIPLGGMEFFLTLLSAYKQAKDQEDLFVPKMIGITLPVILQRNGRLQVSTEDPYESRNYAAMAKKTSLQVTSSEDKSERRIPTWREAMRELDLSDYDIKHLFSATTFENGLYYLSRF